MNRIVPLALGLLAVIGVAAAVLMWGTRPVETDADDTLVRREELPADFPLAPLPATEGTLRDVTVRNLATMTTVTATYELAEGVDEDAILERYAALMADQHATPKRTSTHQVRAQHDRGMMTAQIVRRDGARDLTLVAVREEDAPATPR